MRSANASDSCPGTDEAEEMGERPGGIYVPGSGVFYLWAYFSMENSNLTSRRAENPKKILKNKNNAPKHGSASFPSQLVR